MLSLGGKSNSNNSSAYIKEWEDTQNRRHEETISGIERVEAAVESVTARQES
jgi:hypothetical protein